MGFGSISTFFDVANAFPSLSQAKLDDVVNDNVPLMNQHLMRSRHQRPLLTLIDDNCPPRALCVSANVGDKQGDGPAAQKLILAYDPAVAE
eukprot:10258922-Heterocapsa_arctica.AAC.1